MRNQERAWDKLYSDKGLRWHYESKILSDVKLKGKRVRNRCGNWENLEGVDWKGN